MMMAHQFEVCCKNAGRNKSSRLGSLRSRVSCSIRFHMIRKYTGLLTATAQILHLPQKTNNSNQHAGGRHSEPNLYNDRGQHQRNDDRNVLGTFPQSTASAGTSPELIRN